MTTSRKKPQKAKALKALKKQNNMTETIVKAEFKADTMVLFFHLSLLLTTEKKAVIFYSSLFLTVIGVCDVQVASFAESKQYNTNGKEKFLFAV